LFVCPSVPTRRHAGERGMFLPLFVCPSVPTRRHAGERGMFLPLFVCPSVPTRRHAGERGHVLAFVCMTVCSYWVSYITKSMCRALTPTVIL